MAWKSSKAGQIIWYMDRTYPVLPTLMGNNQLPKVIEGVRFKDGMQVDETKTHAAA